MSASSSPSRHRRAITTLFDYPGISSPLTLTLQLIIRVKRRRFVSPFPRAWCRTCCAAAMARRCSNSPYALSLLLTCTLGVIEFGRVMWTQNALHYAVADAARCMTFDATDCGSAYTTESYAARISGLTFANATTVFTATSGASCGSSITGKSGNREVTVSHSLPRSSAST